MHERINALETPRDISDSKDPQPESTCQVSESEFEDEVTSNDQALPGPFQLESALSHDFTEHEWNGPDRTCKTASEDEDAAVVCFENKSTNTVQRSEAFILECPTRDAAHPETAAANLPTESSENIAPERTKPEDFESQTEKVASERMVGSSSEGTDRIDPEGLDAVPLDVSCRILEQFLVGIMEVSKGKERSRSIRCANTYDAFNLLFFADFLQVHI